MGLEEYTLLIFVASAVMAFIAFYSDSSFVMLITVILSTISAGLAFREGSIFNGTIWIFSAVIWLYNYFNAKDKERYY